MEHYLKISNFDENQLGLWKESHLLNQTVSEKKITQDAIFVKTKLEKGRFVIKMNQQIGKGMIVELTSLDDYDQAEGHYTHYTTTRYTTPLHRCRKIKKSCDTRCSV